MLLGVPRFHSGPRRAPSQIRWLVGVALGVMLVLIDGWARAASAPDAVRADFSWDADPTHCPTEDEVRGELEALLGRPLAEHDGARVSVIARARPSSAGWSLRLWIVSDDATRQRHLDAERCAPLAEAAAVFAAMAIDPGAVEVDAEPPPPQEPEERPPEPPKPSERPPRVVQGIVRAEGGVSWGVLPGAGPTVGLAAGLHWPRARVEVEGRYAFVRRARFTDEDGSGADLRHASAIVRGCGIPWSRPGLEVVACGGVEAGALLGEGVGFRAVREDTIPWLALDVSAGLIWLPHPRVGLSVRAEPWVALLRRSFLVEELGAVWQPQRAGVRGLGGVEIRL